MARPKKEHGLDWSAIYADWLTGTMTNVAIARKYGCSAASIGQRIKRDGWTNLKGPHRQAMITETPEPETPTKRADKPVISKSMTADQLRQRAKNLAQRLLAEVEDATTYEGEIADAILAEETDLMQRRAVRKALSSGERIKNLKEITAIIDAVDPERKTKGKDTDEATPKGKKAERQNSAEKAASAGPFAMPSPPRLVASK